MKQYLDIFEEKYKKREFNLAIKLFDENNFMKNNSTTIKYFNAKFRIGELEIAKKGILELIRNYPKIKNPSPYRILCEISILEKDIISSKKYYDIFSSKSKNETAITNLKRKVENLKHLTDVIKLIDQLNYNLTDTSNKNHNKSLEIAKQIAKYHFLIPEDKKIKSDLNYIIINLFAKSENLHRTLNNYDPEVIQKSYEYGYFNWPFRINDYIFNKKVIDVGCGFGGFGSAFLAAGASEYVGLDPQMVLNSTTCKNKRTRKHATFPKTPLEISKNSPGIRLYQSTAEKLNISETFDVISLANVTEHLINIEQVFQGFIPLCHKNTKIIFLHHNFYCWNGHHQLPNRLKQLKIDDPEQKNYYDWRHIEYAKISAPDHYFNYGLNKISLKNLKNLIEKNFNILEWKKIYHKEDISSRLTDELFKEIYSKNNYLEKDDLLVNTVFAVLELK